VKNCKIPQFSFFLIAIQFKCYLITEMISWAWYFNEELWKYEKIQLSIWMTTNMA
jgi:hypothetical protein